MKGKTSCKDCRNFKREYYEDDGTPQTCGTCLLLYKILFMDNAPMWFMKNIRIQDSFKCSLFKRNETQVKSHVNKI